MKMKKFLAVLLSLSLVLSLAAPMALALEGEEGGTHTEESGGGSDDSDSGETGGDSDDSDSSEESGETGDGSGEEGEEPGGDSGETGDGSGEEGEEPGGDSGETGDGSGEEGEEPGGDSGETGDGSGEEGEEPGGDSGETGDGSGEEGEEPGGDSGETGDGSGEEGEEPGGDSGETDDGSGEDGEEPEEPNKPGPVDPENPEIPVDPEVPVDPEEPPLSEEDQAALDELGGKVDAVTDETSKEDLEAIKNSPLFDRLSDEQKAAVLAKLEAIGKEEAKKQEQLEILGGKVDNLSDETTREELLAIKNDPLFMELTPEQQQAVLDRLMLLEELVPALTGSELYNKLMATETIKEFNLIYLNATRAELDSLLELTSEELAALQEHFLALASLAAEDRIPFIPPVNFTDAGPLLNVPRVKATATPMRARRMMTRTVEVDPMSNPVAEGKENGKMFTSKKLEVVNDQLQLTIEAYATGSYTSSEVVESVPADIVLVLDQSSSMVKCIDCGTIVERPENLMQDINGRGFYVHQHKSVPLFASPEAFLNLVVPEDQRCSNEQFIVTGTDWEGQKVGFLGSYEDTSRQAVLAEAVNSFLANLNKSEVDHRIGVVTYGGEMAGQGDGATAIRRELSSGLNSIDAYLRSEPHSTTPTGKGMALAREVFEGVDSGDRKKVLILFTDGYPAADADTGWFVREEPRDKTDDPAYTPEAYQDFANAALRHASALKAEGVDIYTVGIFSRADGQSFPNYIQENQNAKADDPNELQRANRFMQMLSSNCGTDATYLGADVTCDLGKGHYLSPADGQALIDAFVKISESITGSTSDVNLGTTVVRDAISTYFEVNGEVQAYDVEVKGDKEISTPRVPSEVRNSTFNSNAIQTVEAEYDFNKNFLVEGEGHKLRIVIPIKPKTDFWGGNNVPTNIPALSGVFTDMDDDKQPETCIKALHPDFKNTEELAYPKANVPMDFPVWTIKDHYIYYGDSSVQYTDLFNIDDVPNDWRTDYIDRTPQIDGDTKLQYKEDQKYDLTITFSPKYEKAEDGSVGTEVTPEGGHADAQVLVFKPTVSFGDMRTYLTVKPSDEELSKNPATVVWKHGETAAGDVEISGKEAPTLTYTIKGRVNALHGTDTNQAVRDYYAFVTEVSFSNGEVIETRTDKGVAINQAVVTFAHRACEDIISKEYKEETGEFLVHVFKPQITFTDMTVYKGTAKEGFTYEGSPTVVWTYPGEIKDGATLELPGKDVKVPGITYEYKPNTDYLYEGTCFQKDTPVAVQVKLDGKVEYTPAGVTTPHNINECIIFHWNHNCGLQNPQQIAVTDHNKGHQFYVHVIPCELTVTKSISGDAYSGEDSFLFKITGKGGMAEGFETEIFIEGASSKTLTGLPVGTYTVTEDANWSWRYKQIGIVPSNGEVTLGEATGGKATVMISNELTNSKWLSSEDVKVNLFSIRNPSGEDPQSLSAAALFEDQSLRKRNFSEVFSSVPTIE